MKVTNRFGYSASWVNAANKYLNQYDKVGWRSITTLNDSPRIAILRDRHSEEIEVDVSELMWLLLGQVVHMILESNADEKTIAEQRILVPFEGKEISMKADYLDPIPGTNPQEYTVQDYKITKVYAWKMGVNKSQEAQNNLYQWGYSKMGIKCTRGELEMFLKDFSPLDYIIDKHNNPEHEVMRMSVRKWSDEKCEEYLKERIRLFVDAETKNDADLPECTLNERWADEDRFAVKAIKDGKVSDKASPGASKFSTRREAEEWVASKKSGNAYHIEFRKGESRRCERNSCWVNKWCNQYNCNISPDF